MRGSATTPCAQTGAANRRLCRGPHSSPSEPAAAPYLRANGGQLRAAPAPASAQHDTPGRPPPSTNHQPRQTSRGSRDSRGQEAKKSGTSRRGASNPRRTRPTAAPSPPRPPGKRRRSSWLSLAYKQSPRVLGLSLSPAGGSPEPRDIAGSSRARSPVDAPSRHVNPTGRSGESAHAPFW